MCAPDDGDVKFKHRTFLQLAIIWNEQGATLNIPTVITRKLAVGLFKPGLFQSRTR